MPDDELVLTREVRRGLPTAWVTLAIILVTIGAIGAAILSLSPTTQTVRCDRRARACTLSPQYVVGSDRRFSLETARQVELVADAGHPAIGIWTRDRKEYWTGAATDRAMADEYRRVVDALHAFTDGDAPTLEVQFATSHLRMILSLVLGTIALSGLYAFFASRYSRRTELRLDRAAGTVTVRGTWFVRGKREVTRPLSSVTGVALDVGRTVLELRLMPGWCVHREAATQDAREVMKTWAAEIEAFLGKRPAPPH